MQRTLRKMSLFSVALLMLTLVGCRSQRTATSTDNKHHIHKQLAPLATPHSNINAFTAKTHITVDYNGHAMSVKGKLRMRHDEVVQVTFTALGVVEIAFIEFTPQGAYIIDRINKRYAKIDYSSGILSSAGINFTTIQSLFWNRLFIPGEKESWKQLDEFRVSPSGNQTLIEPQRQRLLKCQFYTDNEYQQLQQTRLNLQHYEAIWQYSTFNMIGTHTYPTSFDVSISGSSRAIGAHITLSDISTTDTGWKSGTNLSNYKEVEFDQLLSILNMFK